MKKEIKEIAKSLRTDMMKNRKIRKELTEQGVLTLEQKTLVDSLIGEYEIEAKVYHKLVKLVG